MFTKRQLIVLLFLTFGIVAATPASPPQDPVTPDGVLVVWSSGDQPAAGGAGREAVVGLGFAAGADQVVAYLPRDIPDTVVVASVGGTRWPATLQYHDESGLATVCTPWRMSR